MGILVRRHFGYFFGLAVLVPIAILVSSAQVQAQKFGGGGGSTPKGGGGFQPPSAPKPPAFQPPSMPKMPGTQPPKAPGFQPPPGNNNQPMVPIFIPPGGINQPVGPNQVTHVTVWRCNKCNSVVSQGSMRPSLNSCPNCGVLFNNGQNTFTATTTPVNTSGPVVAQADFRSVPFIFGGVLFMLVDVGIMIAVISMRVARA